MLLNLSLIAMLQLTANLPNGYEAAVWGTTAKQLEKHVEVHKATPGSEYNYSDHMETDPEVYVQLTEQDKRIEYYFFKGKLYKIYIVYNKSLTSDKFYQQKVDAATEKYGEPKDQFDESYFGLPVKHTYWEGEQSVLDLRSGAGFIYEVLIDKKAAMAKKIRRQLKRAI
jgi:hypothetical protein